MNKKEKNELREWIRRWEKAGAVLEQARQAELDKVDVQKAIENLDDAFESALFHFLPKSISGLVELQAWLSKVRL